MSAPLVTVDVEGAVRTWLRTVPQVASLVDTRVFFQIPPETAWPILTLQEVGGSIDEYVPTQSSLLQIDCWGSPHPTPGKTNKSESKEVCLAVCNALRALNSGTALNDEVVALGALILSAPWVPDPASNQARYSITAEVFAKPA